MEEIETRGGMKKAIETGWVESEIRNAQFSRQKEIEEGKKVIIGVNRFRKPFEDEKISAAHRIPLEVTEKHLDNMKKFRQNRNGKRLAEGLENLYKQAKDPTANLVYPAIEAAEVGATHAEMLGVIRMAHGERFDPFGEIEPTFDASFVSSSEHG
jgi:methylmalonyl-CoA mutase N-terminal domain/subunit